MLLRALFLALAIAALAETLLHASATLALTALRERGVEAVQAEFASAAQTAQSEIAAAAEENVLPTALPSPSPTCALAGPTGCELTASASIDLATPAATPSVCPSAGCGAYLQENAAIDEGRAAVTIDAIVTNSSGTDVATRSATVVFRTLRIAPYAALTGVLDDTLDGVSGTSGDSAGEVPTDATAGTLINVLYRNAQSGATMPANVWSGIAPSAPLSRTWSP